MVGAFFPDGVWVLICENLEFELMISVLIVLCYQIMEFGYCL